MAHVTATCTDPKCAPAQVYGSSTIKNPYHAQRAWDKAARLAREHAVATGHDVQVWDGSSVKVVACRCARCGAATPGQASGLCEGCFWKDPTAPCTCDVPALNGRCVNPTHVRR